MLRKVVCCIVIGLMVFGVFVAFSTDDNDMQNTTKVTPPNTQKQSPPLINVLPPNPQAYTPHNPIRINSDVEFDNYALNRTIWGLEINGTGKDFCIYIGNCSQSFTIKNCYLHNASGKFGGTYIRPTGIQLYNSSNGMLLNNTCTGNKYDGISLHYSDINTLKNNNCSSNNNDGIFKYYSNMSTLLSNNCSENVYAGIHLYESNNDTFIENNCSLNGQYGIFLYYSNTHTIAINYCCGNSRHGFFLISSSFNTITNNTGFGNSWNGISIVSSIINLIMKNNFNRNSYYGISLVDSSINILMENKMQGNIKYGVYIAFAVSSSTKNSIHNNNFINNNAGGKQAYDSVGSNFWNSSYPSGGNYWSDWTSPDIKKGPNQDQSGSDGIVDSPYLLDGSAGAKDFYPLTTQVIIPEPSPAPLVIISVLLITVLLVRRRK